MNVAAVRIDIGVREVDRELSKVVLFCHPTFRASQSMPRFAEMLRSEYEKRGLRVELWSPTSKVFNWTPAGSAAKWGGYIDQYVLFPLLVRKALKSMPKDVMFVFCDQALGPWVPLVKDRPHVVHVHDLLALRSALGEVPENPTSITGRMYQRYIRRGFRQARHFISISKKTRADLHRVGGISAVTSEVVYNGLNFPFVPLDPSEADRILTVAGFPAPVDGMLLHVGGGQWYKNLAGIVRLYGCYASRTASPKPLWCISPHPNAKVRRALQFVPANGNVLFFKNVDSRVLQAAYSRADVLLFPSLAEGFGWPLIEAQACGCPVITTDEAPMNEVAGEVATYIPRLLPGDDVGRWASNGAESLRGVLERSPEEKRRVSARAVAWAAEFSVDRAISAYLEIYQRVLRSSSDLSVRVAPPDVGGRS